MKYMLLLSLLFYATLSLAKTSATDFNNAKNLFDNKQYQKSYDAFYSLFQKDLENPNINFYLGSNAYMLQNYEIAISAYERVLNIDSKSIRSNLEIAKCYFELKNYKKAKEIFSNILKQDIPLNVKENVILFVEAIDSKQQKHFFTNVFIFGINYDSNIISNNDDNFALANNPANLNTQNNKTGFAHQEILSIGHKYKINDSVNVKNDFLYFQKAYFNSNNSKYDINFIQYSPAISVVYKKYMIDYAMFANKIYYGSEPLMYNYGLHPKIKYLYSPDTIIDGSLKYQKKSATNTDLNTDLLALDSKVKYKYDKQFAFTLYALIQREKRLQGNLTDTDYDMLNVSASLEYIYKSDIILTPSFHVSTKSYTYRDVNYNKKRNDNEYKVLLNTTYLFSKKLIFNFDVQYTQHNSNIPQWEFDKTSITTNVIVLF
ncbi:tetratricopeptide repeat protein [Sulfurimonas sp. SAG-AH-194-I05]|nr:tetratricopeptide repeat protein [Sulfurimonas sp. SAG-AH-194-I05]MDF1874848.1 tetratricopeptide repeat protein [Sulfurimonas sp. SAG-AH-194-I05]